jgi:hypothetical protein
VVTNVWFECTELSDALTKRQWFAKGRNSILLNQVSKSIREVAVNARALCMQVAILCGAVFISTIVAAGGRPLPRRPAGMNQHLVLRRVRYHDIR